MNISKVFKYIIIGAIIIMLSACSSKSGGDATTTPSDTNTTKTVITKVADFINGGTAPTLTDYTNAGITGVTAENIDELNTLIKTKTTTEVDTIAKIQAIVALLGGSTAIETLISDYINGGTPPTVEDYKTLGVSGVDATNIDRLNAVIATKNITEVDTVAKIEAILNSILTSTDTTKPIITINGATDMNVSHGATYTEQGASISDNESGLTLVISGEVNTSKVGVYTVRYNTTDSGGNIADEQNRIVRVVDTTAPVIFIKGSNPYTIDYGATYSDDGAYATDNVDANRSLSGYNSVDTSKLGEYNITYNHTDSAGNSAIAKSRTVKVVDRVAPTITLNGDADINTTYGISYTDANATFSDNVDSSSDIYKKITDSVDTDTIGDYSVTYFARDKSDNNTTKVRVVHVIDDTPPIITLKGDNPFYLIQGQNYNEPNATAEDDLDGNITTSIVISDIGTNPPADGNYTISYNVTDSSGNSAIEVTRTVVVAPNKAPTVTAVDINLTEGDRVETNSSDKGIDVNASDKDGSIIRYIFKENNTTIYEHNGSTPPSTISPLSIGEHNLTITVVDDYNLSSTEANITIWVKIGDTNIRKSGQVVSQAKYDDGYYQYGGVESNYTTDSNNNIKDNLTGLVWDDNGSVDTTIYNHTTLTVTFDYKTICEYYLGSGTAWRGPTRKEMLNLLEYSGTSPSINSIFNNYDSDYWTATTDGSKSFFIDFTLAKSEKSNTSYKVHCIDDTTIKPIKDANFSRTVDDTVIDHNTMLEWQDDNISADMNWTDALTYCHDLNLSDIEGIEWRVPNVRELLSIVDDNTTDPSIDSNLTKTYNGDYWTSTTKAINEVYKVSFSNGDMKVNSPIADKKVRCVRTRREASFYQ